MDPYIRENCYSLLRAYPTFIITGYMNFNLFIGWCFEKDTTLRILDVFLFTGDCMEVPTQLNPLGRDNVIHWIFVWRD